MDREEYLKNYEYLLLMKSWADRRIQEISEEPGAGGTGVLELDGRNAVKRLGQEPGTTGAGDAEVTALMRELKEGEGREKSRLGRLGRLFSLSAMEQIFLFLSILPEFSQEYGRIFSWLNGDGGKRRPTMGTAAKIAGLPPALFAMFREGLSEDCAFLRYMIDGSFAERGEPFWQREILPKERIAEYILGIDRALGAGKCLYDVSAEQAEPFPCMEERIGELAQALSILREGEKDAVLLTGSAGSGKRELLRQFAFRCGKKILCLELGDAEGEKGEERGEERAGRLMRNAVREAVLGGYILAAGGFDGDEGKERAAWGEIEALRRIRRGAACAPLTENGGRGPALEGLILLSEKESRDGAPGGESRTKEGCGREKSRTGEGHGGDDRQEGEGCGGEGRREGEGCGGEERQTGEGHGGEDRQTGEGCGGESRQTGEGCGGRERGGKRRGLKFRCLELFIGPPTHEERAAIWACYLEKYGIRGADPERLAGKFRFLPGQIRGAVDCYRDAARLRKKVSLYEACFAQLSSRLYERASKVKSSYAWDQLILPKEQKILLRDICSQMENRHIVYDVWGFGKTVAYGRGVTAAFAGPPGTGKTMAAQILAGELNLELFKVDLSQMVSKYVGETEKNLSSVFREAEASNAILFFDEADSLFGRRSEVKSSNDRYANLETSYLLQRIEEYEGMVVLATNYLNNIDEAFMRRLKFIIQFQLPDAASRKKIWQVTMPEDAPLEPDIDYDFLAENLELSGGNIKNIAVYAAFMAAEQKSGIGMSHLLRAARYELKKNGKILEREELKHYAGILDQER